MFPPVPPTLAYEKCPHCGEKLVRVERCQKCGKEVPSLSPAISLLVLLAVLLLAIAASGCSRPLTYSECIKRERNWQRCENLSNDIPPPGWHLDSSES